MIQNEIFGPVMTVQQFDDEAKAIEWANGTPLRAGVLGVDARHRARPPRGQRPALRHACG